MHETNVVSLRLGYFSGRDVCSEECTYMNHCGTSHTSIPYMEIFKSVITHKRAHANTYSTHALLLIRLIFQPSGSEPISSQQRILISSMAQWDFIDTTIIHPSCLNVNPMLGSLRIHHVIEGFLQPVDELGIQ